MGGTKQTQRNFSPQLQLYSDSLYLFAFYVTSQRQKV